MKNRNRRSKAINFSCCTAALLIVLSVWAALDFHGGVTAMAGRTGMPVYRGRDGSGVSLVIAVPWASSAFPELLEKLDETGVKVTFAFTNEVIASSPELVREAALRGHEAALYSESGAEDKEELERLSKLIREITGAPPGLVLCGSETAGKLAYRASRAGLSVVVGSVDLRPIGDQPSELAGSVRSQAFDGCIFIAEPTRALADELYKIVDFVKNLGADIVPAHKMLYN